MKKLAALLAVIIFLCSCCNILSNVPGGRAAANKDIDKTVALVAQRGKEVKPYCSAVWVSDKYLLTAYHCVQGYADFLNSENAEASTLASGIIGDEEAATLFPIVVPQNLTIQFVLPSEITEIGKRPSAIHDSNATLLYHGYDLALLEVVNPKSVTDHGIATLADKEPEVGDTLGFVGMPGGLYFTYFTGTYAAFRSDIMYVPTLGPFAQVSAPIWYGNSGGGDFDQYSHLVGIASFMHGSVPNCGFYIPVETIRSVLIGARIMKANLLIKGLDPEL